MTFKIGKLREIQNESVSRTLLSLLRRTPEPGWIPKAKGPFISK